MTDCSPDNFVDREEISDAVVERLLLKTTKQRSIIIQGAGQSGKTCLLSKIQHLLSINRQKTIVIKIISDDLNKQHTHIDALFYLLLERVWKVVEEALINVATPPGSPIFNRSLDELIRYSGNIGIALNYLAEELSKIKPPLYLIILFDGVEEIDHELLEQFERDFLAPLFKQTFVRIATTSRAVAEGSAKSPWHTWMKQRTDLLRLNDFDHDPLLDRGYHIVAMKQFTQLQARKVIGDELSFEEVRSQLRHYRWNNIGVNATLMRAAALVGGQITTPALDDCLNTLLQNAKREPLSALNVDYLWTLVKRFPTLEDGLDIAQINSCLEMEDIARNDFMGKLAQGGQAWFKERMLYINPEIATLMRDRLERGV